MKICEKEILDKFILLSSLDTSEAIYWLEDIKINIAQVLNIIKPNADIENYATLIKDIIAIITYKNYCMVSDNVSINLQDVNVSSNKSRVQYAEKLLDEKLSQISSILMDNNFLFGICG